MTKNHDYDRDTALDHAVTLAVKGRIDPEDVLTSAKEFLGFLDPPTLEVETGTKPPPVTVYWDEDKAYPYYRWFRGQVA